MVIALGTELGEPVHYGQYHHWEPNEAGRKWIYAERDPLAIGVNRRIDVPLLGDLRDVVPQLTAALAPFPRAASPDLERWVQAQASHKLELAEAAPARPRAGASGAAGGGSNESLSERRDHGARWRRDYHLHLDLFAGGAA